MTKQTKLATIERINKIFYDLRKEIGNFESEPIGHSYGEKNRTFLLTARQDKYILKTRI